MKYSTSPITSQTNSLYSGSRSTSPLPPPATTRRDCLSATTKSYKYLRRLLKFDQMDFQFALWQMLYLFISPQKVYRNFNYRKQTKSQFARDDPAFLVLLIVCLCVTSLIFSWTLIGLSIGQTIYFIFYVVFVDFLFAGVIVASFLWLITNRYLRGSQIDADIEWGYAFDVHINAFFPPLILLHFIQLFFYNAIIKHEWFFSTFLGNTIWLMALTYYIYITFLGYNCLSFLKNTRIILAPLPILFLFYVVTIIIGLNLMVAFMSFYQYRVL